MDPTAEIRPATIADRDAVADLLVAQLRGHAIATPAADLARTVAALLARPQRARFLLAVAGARAVGLAVVSFGWPVEHGGRGAWLEELYVVPEARGQGTGTRLLDAALDAARTHGAVAVDLEIERGHERAASLYRRHGFTPLERTRWVKRLTSAGGTSPSPPAVVAGGCFCGAVRYEIRGHLREASHCHCPSCRRAAGAPVVTWATYPRDALRFTRGTAKELRSSPPVTRTFCAACGTPLTYVTRDEPEWIDVTVGSMDDPDAVPPVDHIWTTSQLGWLAIDDDLPRLPRGHRA